MWSRVGWIAVIGISWTGWLDAQPWDAAELEKTVRGAADAYVKAYEAGDADKLVALFTPEAEYIDGDGTVFHGRDAIRAEYVAMFETVQPGKLEIEIVSIRPIAAGVLVEEGIARRAPSDDGPVSASRYTATHVRQADGKWLIASVRQLNAEEMTAHDRLRELEWLVGTWRDQSTGDTIDTEWKWTDDGSYLEARFHVRRAGESAVQGTHRVGWDAQRKQFRSWIFDSEGGFAGGLWSYDEGTWLVPLTAVLNDGGSASATLIYRRLSKDVMEVGQRDRVVDGERLPDVLSRVARKPPEPQ